MKQNEYPDIENEMTANAMRVRRNELEQALREPINPERAKEICDELTEIGISIDKMYLPMDAMKTNGYETPMQIRESLGI